MFPRCCIGTRRLSHLSIHYNQNFNGNIQFHIRNIHNITNKKKIHNSRHQHLVGSGAINVISIRNASDSAADASITQPIFNSVVASSTERLIPSTGPSVTDLPPIPEAPAAPPEIVLSVTENIQQLAAGAEPTFASIGLGGWSPAGMIQQCLEFVHITCDIPWWGTIIIGTIVVRTIMFPLVVLSQRNAAKMNNNLPQMQVLQMKMSEARQSGNALESARYAQELMLFMKEKELNPLKSLAVPLAQAPIFISFFVGLRQMANAPVESLTTGGMLWFIDLTMPDQYFLLPLITSATLYLTIELGTDTARLNSQNMHLMKYFLRALPIIIFPFTMNFPGAILCYWATSNFVSLIQVGILKVPKVREFCKIEKLIVHTPDALPIKSKKFIEGFKESWTNMKITRELQERERIDDIQFQRAGREALVKTYKYDPTRVRQPTSAAAIQAKKR